MGNKSVMSVSTLGDLTALMNHNFQVADKRMSKLFRKNRSVTVLALTAIGLVIWSEVERRKQEGQIYQLSIKVKELEYGKGE